MRSRAARSPLVQMRQQTASEDGKVMIAQALEQQRRQRLCCGHNIEGTPSRPVRYVAPSVPSPLGSDVSIWEAPLSPVPAPPWSKLA